MSEQRETKNSPPRPFQASCQLTCEDKSKNNLDPWPTTRHQADCDGVDDVAQGQRKLARAPGADKVEQLGAVARVRVAAAAAAAAAVDRVVGPYA